jgi:opacity protein-like surface antigen
MRNVFASAVAVSFALATAGFTQDLTGFYGGLSMATHDGTHDYDDGDSEYDLEGPAFGGFVGYMVTGSKLSYGGELAVSKGGVYEVSTDGETTYKDEYEYTRFIDLKGRVGYNVSNVMLYGTVGLSRAHFISDVDDSVNAKGYLLGVGAEYKINDKFFVGAEYLHRNYDYVDPFQEVDIDANINSVGLRAGISF